MTKILARIETYKPKKIISLVSKKKLRIVKAITKPPKPKILSIKKDTKNIKVTMSAISTKLTLVNVLINLFNFYIL